ncbi:hypothetical protein PISMIDRAFT_689944 [Pisolithus microcarpus 441]|uniref:G domain-containing protein n=1 Tax=Pisolithus microcarpus 441 TaxID=765257 RepID=A0A0C9YVM7_9AGAM|nr:P-loop containing nucleoside triphosphate hydrolase protein [Pisolithus microcarpus]KIK11928.1 hypothetical protein PISMIDRAFT_689944 [Pisolithus microcarpus 441]
MSPSQVKHLFAHSSGSNSRFLPHSPITCATDEVDGKSSSSGVVNGASRTLGNTTDCEAYESDRRTPPPRSRGLLSTLLDRLHLRSNADRDVTAADFDDEAIGQISPSTSPVDEVPISQDDIVIAVMGPAGSGKTTFINRAVGSPHVGRGSTPFTKEVCPVRYPHPDGVRSIILVDTPGCNAVMTDFHVLGEIALWLTRVYEKNIKLNGILYFHPISNYEIRERMSRNYNIFKELCGKDNFKNVIFVTTMWDRVSEEVGSEREQYLQSDFWRAMISLGSAIHRFEGTTESAWKIINSLPVPHMAERRPLQIQREMVDDCLPLHQAAAGRAIIDRLFFLSSGSKQLTKGKKKSRSQATRPTRISITLSDDPFATLSAGTEIFTLSSSGNCSGEGYGSALARVIRALRAATGAPELLHMHYIKDAITVCLVIALSIGPTTGTHHAFLQIVEIATLLINMVVERVKQAKQTRISADIKTAMGEFEKEMKGVQDIVRDLAQRTPEARRILRSTDVSIISSCASSMRAVCDALRSTSSISHDFDSMDDGFEALKRGLDIENCSCGISTEPEQVLLH